MVGLVARSQFQRQPWNCVPHLQNFYDNKEINVFSLRQSRASRGDIKEEGKSDSVQSYYEFLINEGSYKFWAAFQLGTAALLIYSAFAAVYYAKYTYATTTVDYDDYDFFFKRSGENLPEPTTSTQRSTFLGLSADTYQRILDAISNKKDS